MLSLSLSQSSLIASNKKQGDNNNSNSTNSIIIGAGNNNNNNNNNTNSNVYTIDTTNIPTKNNYIFLGYSSSDDTMIPEYVYDSTNNTFTPSSVTINAPTEGSEASLTLYAVWKIACNPNATTIDDAVCMQDMNANVCSSMTLDQQYTLTDSRLYDNHGAKYYKTYTVAKLKMNTAGTETKCWMTQNLALNLSTTTTLTNEDTDLNSVTSFTPIRNTIATGSLNSTTWQNDNNTPYSYDSGNTSYGNYYNWSAAVASNNTSTLTTAYTNAPDSICPKGWRLPQIYNGSSTNRPNEFGNLLYAYSIINNAFPGLSIGAGWASNGFAKIQQAPINFSLAGHLDSGTIAYLGVGSNNWSSSIYSATYAYRIGFDTGEIFPHTNMERGRRGYPVRCILR